MRNVDRALGDAFPSSRARSSPASLWRGWSPPWRPACGPVGSRWASLCTPAPRPMPTRRWPNDAAPGAVGTQRGLDRSGEDVVGAIVDGRRLACDTVLVAAGPWSPAVIDRAAHGRPSVTAGASWPRSSWPTIRATSWRKRRSERSSAGCHTRGRSLIRRPWSAGSDEPAEELLDFSLVPLPGMASVGSTFLSREPEPAAWVESISRARAPSCRPWPTHPSAGRGPAPDRRAPTDDRSSDACPDDGACSSARATARGASPPDPLRRASWSTRCWAAA